MQNYICKYICKITRESIKRKKNNKIIYMHLAYEKNIWYICSESVDYSD